MGYIENFKVNALIVFTFLAFYTSNGYAQEVPNDYKFYASIDAPRELKWGIPNDFLIDSTRTWMIVGYDYKPSYLEFYNTKDKSLVRRIVIPGWIYLDGSYISLEENAAYIDVGRGKSKYIKIDLETFERSKIRCKDAPYGCDYFAMDATQPSIYTSGNVTISRYERYLFKRDDEKIEIYLREN